MKKGEADMRMSLEGVTIAARYELGAHLATGGMATVFAARDHRLRRPVAIKALRELEDAAPRDIERFRREAQATAALRSPYIVEVYDFFADEGCYYLVMELVEGENLKELLLRRGPLPAEEALPIIAQVCRALSVAHAHGFIHRDLKPQNVLLDAVGNAKLTDFGIVHIARARGLTTSGIVLGTADYISPEQAQGQALTPASDLYSLGVMLYELLSGSLPFNGATPISVALKHASEPPPALRRLNGAVHPAVERVVMRALAKDPQRRYPSARALEAALVRALEGAPADAAQHGRSHQQSAASRATSQPAGRTATQEPVAEWRMLAERIRASHDTPATPYTPTGASLLTPPTVTAATASIAQHAQHAQHAGDTGRAWGGEAAEIARLCETLARDMMTRLRLLRSWPPRALAQLRSAQWLGLGQQQGERLQRSLERSGARARRAINDMVGYARQRRLTTTWGVAAALLISQIVLQLIVHVR